MRLAKCIKSSDNRSELCTFTTMANKFTKAFKTKLFRQERWIEDILLNHANPKIKLPITKGKLIHRGIKLIQSSTEAWIEQRGVQIGEKFKD